MNNSMPPDLSGNPMARILAYLHDSSVARVRITLPRYKVPSRNTTKREHWSRAVKRNRAARAALVTALLTDNFVAESRSSIGGDAISTKETGTGKT